MPPRHAIASGPNSRSRTPIVVIGQIFCRVIVQSRATYPALTELRRSFAFAESLPPLTPERTLGALTTA